MKRVGFGALLLLLCLAPPARPGAAAPEAEPAAPEWVVAQPLENGRGIGLRWNAVPGATAYEIFRGEEGGESRPLATVPQIQHLDEAIRAGIAYGYRLRALIGGVPGPFSEELVVRLPAAAAAGEIFAPRWRKQRVEMTERAGAQPSFRVELGWGAVGGAVGYRLWRSTVGGGASEPIGTYTGLTAVDEAVESGREYLYVLTAFDAQLRDSPRSLELPMKVAPEFAAKRPAKTDTGFPARLVWEVGNIPPRGDRAPGKAQLTDPVDLAFDGRRDRVYVSSARYRHIVALRGGDGLPAGVIGPRLGKYELLLPLGLGVDGGGNLIVVDQGQAALFVVAPDGALVRRIPVKTAKAAKAPRLIDAAAHRDGRIFVTDAANGKVLVFSADGRQLSSWGKAGSRPEEFGAVGAIEISDDGTVAIADAAAGQIKLFSSSGKFLKGLGARAAGDAGFVFLSGFTRGREGRFLGVDLEENTVKQLGPGSGGATTLPVGSVAGKLQLLGPVAIAGDGKERFFVAEGIANRVVCFTLAPAGAQP